MRVTCRASTAADLPSDYLDPRANLNRSTVFPLTLEREYVVHALLLRKDGVWYQIIDDHALPYPMAYPAPLFEVTNDKLSRSWRFALTANHADHVAIVTFTEWANDPYFYDRLTNGGKREADVFEHAKREREAEEESVQSAS